MAEASIIIPVYNVEKYIDKCLGAIVGQTFSDIEIILLNDGSTDASGEKCLEWAKCDDRIIYVSKKNEGAGPTRNLGIQMASAEFVAFCDPDDWYDERYVELMLEKQKETNADVVVCGCFSFDGNLAKVTGVRIEDISNYTGLWAWHLDSSVCCKLVRRGIFIENDIKMPACLGEDCAIHCYMMIKSNKVALLPQPLYYYQTTRDDSATNDYVRHTSDTVKFLMYSWDLFIRDGVFDEYKKPLLMRAKLAINHWHDRIKINAEYTKRWLSACTTALNDYFGNMALILEASICIVGSYSLYNSVVARTLADKTVESEYCFTGLISYMSDKTAQPPAAYNSFRQTAVERDFQKSFRKNFAKGQFDYIVIDFMDERFDIAVSGGGYYTKSDAFMDADIQFEYSTLDRLDADTIKLWEEKCIEFTELLKENFPPNKIMLVKNFLTEKFGSYDNQTDFDEIYEIRRVNAMIGKCYDFFEAEIPGIHVIDINDCKLRYTFEHFRHGCDPWHYNQAYYAELREKIFDYMQYEYMRSEN